MAIANLFSKKIATIYGVSFTIVLFACSPFPSASTRRKQRAEKDGPGEVQPRSSAADQRREPARAAGLRPGRGSRLQAHGAPAKVLEKTNLRRHDIVVMTVRPVSTGAGEYELRDRQLFADYEQELFSHVVTMAEKEGKTVELLVVPGVDPFDAMVQTAANAESVAAGDGRFCADGFRGTGAPHRTGVGEAAGAAASVLARDHQPDRAVGVREPGAASAAAVARRLDRLHDSGCGSRERAASVRSCIIAMWSAWRCDGWSTISNRTGRG